MAAPLGEIGNPYEIGAAALSPEIGNPIKMGAAVHSDEIQKPFVIVVVVATPTLSGEIEKSFLQLMLHTLLKSACF